MGRLKKGNVNAMPLELAEEIRVLVSKLKAVGLFLVPVGELEGWLADQGVAASKQEKWAWANTAASRIKQIGSQQGDIWDFIRGIGTYLGRELNR